MVNSILNIDDRVVLLLMEGESQISYGDIGTVVGIDNFNGVKQYRVNWDNGSKLSLLSDCDKWMKEEDFIERMKKKKNK